MTEPDASIVPNASLRELCRSRRRDQIAFYAEARHELERSSGTKVCRFGRLNSPRAIALEPGANELVDHLVGGFTRCLHEYALRDFELWVGGEASTPPHNDAYLYLGVGQAVALQFWVLLEACLPGDPPTEITMGKNALECILPIAPGLLWPGTADVIGTEGRMPLACDAVVGGDELRPGDTLMFTNGVVHRAAGSASVLRAALAFRAVLAAEDAREDVDFMLWFRDACRADTALREHLDRQSNPYYRKARVRWNLLPDRPADPARLVKRDRHDRQALRRRIEAFDFGA